MVRGCDHGSLTLAFGTRGAAGPPDRSAKPCVVLHVAILLTRQPDEPDVYAQMNIMHTKLVAKVPSSLGVAATGSGKPHRPLVIAEVLHEDHSRFPVKETLMKISNNLQIYLGSRAKGKRVKPRYFVVDISTVLFNAISEAFNGNKPWSEVVKEIVEWLDSLPPGSTPS